MAESDNRLSRSIHIEAIQTVTPAKMSEPVGSRRISTSVPITEDLLRTHHRVVAYYKNSSSEYSAFSLVGFLKESLNIVLGEYPLFAGRLRKNDKSGEVDQIKFNDAGVRLVQAKAEMSIEEFIDNKKTRDGGSEGVLAYWMDVCYKTPHFSPLLYVQVTSFEGNGYSISLSCSVLLADPVMMTEFMRAWAQVHATILMCRKKSLGDDVVPIFHLTKFKRPGVTSHLISRQLESSPPTSLFNHEGADDPLNTIREEGGKLYQIQWGEEETRVESVSAWEKNVKEDEDANWDALTTAVANEVVFGDGNTMVHVSYHLESNGGAGILMFPSKKQNVLRWIAAAVAKKN